MFWKEKGMFFVYFPPMCIVFDICLYFICFHRVMYFIEEIKQASLHQTDSFAPHLIMTKQLWEKNTLCALQHNKRRF